MFYEWIYPLHKLAGLSALNVFRYITFRSAYAAVTALLISLVLGPVVIRWLRRVKLGQKVRQEGPQTHLGKAGTPTMGGLLILAAIVVPCLLWGNFHSRQLWIALLATVWLGGHRVPRRLAARGEELPQGPARPLQAGGPGRRSASSSACSSCSTPSRDCRRP